VRDADLRHLVETRVNRPQAIAEAAARRRPVAADPDGHGKLMIIAADHPARGALRAGDRPMAMADRADLLERMSLALSRPGVDGVLGTADIIEDLLLLGALDDKVVVGSMNRGGLAGTAFEMDDRFTAYDATSMAACGTSIPVPGCPPARMPSSTARPSRPDIPTRSRLSGSPRPLTQLQRLEAEDQAHQWRDNGIDRGVQHGGGGGLQLAGRDAAARNSRRHRASRRGASGLAKRERCMKSPPPLPREPLALLSIVIPARNEEGCIAATVAHRKADAPAGSYTAQLFAGGVDRIAKKIGEEATEVVIAAKNGDRAELIWETADLLYHTLVLLAERGIALDEVGGELSRRAEAKG